MKLRKVLAILGGVRVLKKKKTKSRAPFSRGTGFPQLARSITHTQITQLPPRFGARRGNLCSPQKPSLSRPEEETRSSWATPCPTRRLFLLQFIENLSLFSLLRISESTYTRAVKFNPLYKAARGRFIGLAMEGPRGRESPDSLVKEKALTYSRTYCTRMYV